MWDPEVEDRQMLPIEWVSLQLSPALVLTRFFCPKCNFHEQKFTDINTPASSDRIYLIAWQHWRIHCIEKIKLAEPANSDWRDEFLMKCRITDWAKIHWGTELQTSTQTWKYSVEGMRKGFYNFSWSHFLIFSSFLKVIWLCINRLDRLTSLLISIEVKIPFLCCKLNGKASHVILIK